MTEPILLESERMEEPEPVKVENVPSSDVVPVIAKYRISEGKTDCGPPVRLFLEWDGRLYVYRFPLPCS